MKELSPTAKKLLKVIPTTTFAKNNQLAARLGVSTRWVQDGLRELRLAGLIRAEYYQSTGPGAPVRGLFIEEL